MALVQEQNGIPLVSGARITSPHRRSRVEEQQLRNTPHKDFYVTLSPWSYRLWWVIIAMVHVICVGKFSVECLAYWSIPQTNIGVVFDVYDIVMPLSDLYVLSMVHGAIAAAHGLLVLQMVLGSIRSRHLAFFMSVPKGRLLTRSARSNKTTPNDLEKPPTKLLAGFSAIRRLYASVFGRRGLLGFEGKYFAYVYIVREVFETILQSIQAYHMSQLVPHVAINRFFVLIIVVNCWATPIIQHLFTNNLPLERLLCLIFDVMLDFVSTVGIPIRLAVPYLMQYNSNYHDFPRAFWYDDVWLVNMIHELQLVFISSWSDLASQIIFSISLIMSMQAVKRLIRSNSSLRSNPTASSEHLSARKSASWASIVPSWKNSRDSGAFATMSNEVMARISSLIPTQATTTRLKNGMHAVLALWGLLILVLHVRVSFGSVPSHCLVMARPWFGTKSACALMYVNCKAIDGATGNLKELSSAMNSMDEATLTHFVVRHCPHVEIPSQLQSFSKLIGLKIYNSTLVSWNGDAALTAKHHRKVSFLFIVDVNMTEFPLGLQSSDFPQQRLDIEFCGTNLATLPNDLHQKWLSQSYLSLERSNFSSIPETLTRMSLKYLSMAQNPITELPTELLMSPDVQSLKLCGNPIQMLPTEVSPSKSLEWVDVSFSQLQALPVWIDTAFFDHFTLYAEGTPLCKDILAVDANISATPMLTQAREAYQKDRLRCQAALGMSSTDYPYELEPSLDSKYKNMFSF